MSQRIFIIAYEDNLGPSAAAFSQRSDAERFLETLRARSSASFVDTTLDRHIQKTTLPNGQDSPRKCMCCGDPKTTFEAGQWLCAECHPDTTEEWIPIGRTAGDILHDMQQAMRLKR